MIVMGKEPVERKMCPRCGHTFKETEFYTRRDGTRVELCKKCFTAHVNNYDPETIKPLLQQMDYPYIKEVWDGLLERETAKKKVLNGTSIFGKYMASMKLAQYNKYRWADTEKFEQDRRSKLEKEADRLKKYEEKIQEQYDNGLISKEEYDICMSHGEANRQPPAPSSYAEAVGANNNFQDGVFLDENEIPDPSSELTNDDKIFLAMKWGRLYKPNEWILLEKKYNEMQSSFDISDSDRQGTLILVCKTYLKMNQAIDEGDLESYQKLARTYEALRKSGKFTEVQKEEKGSDLFDCVGNLVAYCEKEGGAIPRYDISAPKDIIDTIIFDMKKYTRELIYEDKLLGNQIEAYIKKKELAELKEKDDEETKDNDHFSDEEMMERIIQENEEKEEDKKTYNEKGIEG